MDAFLILFVLAIIQVLVFLAFDPRTKTEKELSLYKDGGQLIDEKKLEEAHLYFDEIIKRDRRSAVAFAGRGKANVLLNNYHSAIYDLGESLKLDNTLPETYLMKGHAHYKLQDFRMAYHEYDRAVWFYHYKNGDAYRWRALARTHLGEHWQAAEDLRLAELAGDEVAAAMRRGYQDIKI
jgi:tetratricopeptide (TPR) repeat protein